MTETDTRDTTAAAQAPEEEVGIFSSLPDILWQRRHLLIWPTVAAGIGGAIAAHLIEPVYQSKAVILIESQQLPDQAIGTGANSIIDERIARVRQRVLSRPDLVKIIRANGLYPQEVESQPLSRIVDEMRSSTSIEALSAAISPNRQGGTSTIAFQIAFDYRDPVKAQAVTQQYVNNFLRLDATTQSSQAVGAASFLDQEATEVQAKLRAVENQVTQMKATNGPLLAMQSMSSGNPVADAARIDSEIASIQSDNARIQVAGASVSPEIANLQSLVASLRAAEAKYSESHPDVVALKAQIEAAKGAAAASAKGGVAMNATVIASNNARIASLRTAKSIMLSESGQARAAQARGPVLAEQVGQLERQADLLRDRYASIDQRRSNAQVSARMTSEQLGERLTLADPPVVPDSPTKPNRPMIVLGAIAAGLAFGVALTLLLELLFRPIRGTKALTIAGGRPPLAIVPDLNRKPSLLLRLLQARSRKKLARARARPA